MRIHAAIFDELGQKRATFTAVILFQKIADHFEGELALEVDDEVLKQVLDKSFQ